MIALLLSPLGRLASGAIVVGALAGGVLWYGHNRYQAGRDLERAAAIERADHLNRQREKDLEELSKLPADRLRCELAGRLYLNGRCD